MAKQYAFTAEKGAAYITADLNVREGAPSGKAPVVKVVHPGDAVKYLGFVTDGELVGSTAKWYMNESGDFLWSGNTTLKAPSAASPATGKILASPLKKLICTQRFGERPDFYDDLGSPKGHNGMDFRTRGETNINEWKQNVFAVLDGTVSQAEENTLNGKFVRIEHANGHESVYLHLSTISVTKGQKVAAKSVIGISGNSGGASEGPHLHFGYRPIKFDKNNGTMGYINPAPFFIDPVTYVS